MVHTKSQNIGLKGSGRGSGKDRKRIYLHIGTHKTGSTALQVWARDNEIQLSNDGLLYPRAGRHEDGHHSAIAWAFSGRYGQDTSVLNLLSREMSSCKQDKILLSGEEFEYLSDVEINRLRSFLSDYDVHVVVFFRDQLGMIRSQYIEWIKQYISNDHFSSFWRFHIQLPEYNYFQLVSRWMRVFGVPNVHIFPYAPPRRNGGGIVECMAPLMGVSAGIHESTKVVRNASPSREIVEGWRYALTTIEAAFGVSFGIYDYRIREESSEIYAWTRDLTYPALDLVYDRLSSNGCAKSTFYGFTVEEADNCIGYFAQSNEQLFALAGRPLWENRVGHYPEIIDAMELDADLIYDVTAYILDMRRQSEVMS